MEDVAVPRRSPARTGDGHRGRQIGLRGNEQGLWSRVLRYWLWPLLIYGTITYLSSIPGKSFPQVPIWNVDKAVHLAEYAPLGFFVARALVKSSGLGFAGAWVLATAVCAGAGGLDEYHQKFVPGRHQDWRDAVADTAGGAMGSLLFLLLWRRRRVAPG